ncbi:hypothetical protein ZIOFF_045231 [Zingiber officinale]|uniref:Mon2/Sec7/BIG1-like dimerisation and cyclophilin-binding domain-containing protein n=1 Tax=Zingiber officinale TaxID=94328 RepID=A0A8J5G2N1_ZINOF|nr:hypothetical protein ZIOFF_045231 [Zingiber officinale]
MALMAVLESDLRALSAEARRRYPAVKDAAEHAILKLRSLSCPTEIAHNEDILHIFLMACDVKSTKLSVIGLSCLQKLIAHNAVAPSAVKDILSTLKEENMAQALGICLRLLENSRSTDSVHSTAAATFRQAVALVFDSVAYVESLPSGRIGCSSYVSRTTTITDEISRSFSTSLSLYGNLVSGGSLKREVLSKVGNLGLRLLEDLTALAAGGSVFVLSMLFIIFGKTEIIINVAE